MMTCLFSLLDCKFDAGRRKACLTTPFPEVIHRFINLFMEYLAWTSEIKEKDHLKLCQSGRLLGGGTFWDFLWGRLKREYSGRHGTRLHQAPTPNPPCNLWASMRINLGTINQEEGCTLSWGYRYMPTMLTILTIHQEWAACPLLGLSQLIFSTSLLRRDACPHFYRWSTEPQKGWEFGQYGRETEPRVLASAFGSKSVVFKYFAHKPPQRINPLTHFKADL